MFELVERQTDLSLDRIVLDLDVDHPLQFGVILDQGIEVVAGQYQRLGRAFPPRRPCGMLPRVP